MHVQSRTSGSLADAIIESARPLLDKPDGAQITLEHKIEPNEPFVVALLPDDADALTVAHGVSQEDARLLEQIHDRRKKGSATLFILVGQRWSSVDYLSDVLDVPAAFLVMKQAGEVVTVRVQRLGERPRIVSLE